MNGNRPVSPTRESQPSHTAVTITLFATGKWQSGAHFARFDSPRLVSSLSSQRQGFATVERSGEQRYLPG